MEKDFLLVLKTQDCPTFNMVNFEVQLGKFDLPIWMVKSNLIYMWISLAHALIL